MIGIGTPPAFDLPEALLSQGYSVRPETDADLPALMRIYAATRAEEMAAVPWDADQKNAFLVQQFGAQRFHYYTHFGDAAFLMIERDGVAVGRLYLHERHTRLHIIDIALLPEARSGGIGTAIIQELQRRAAALGKGVDIFVETYNSALSLYERLGFKADAKKPGDEDSVYLEMDWAPDGVA